MKLVRAHRKIIRRKYSNRKNLGIAVLFFTISNLSIFLLFIKLKGTNENLCPNCHSLFRTRRQITDNKIDNIPKDGIKGSAPNLIKTTKTISPTGQKFVEEFIKKFREINIENNEIIENFDNSPKDWLNSFYSNYCKFYYDDSLANDYLNQSSSQFVDDLESALSCNRQLRNLYNSGENNSYSIGYQKNGIYWCDSTEGWPNIDFNIEQRRNGWVILYFIGMIYMFIALAIVCDEYFVPALENISDKLQLSPDVAGATFMAAGGSAPELFTSIIGVFIADSNVGIGTIVGSAVFNILFVLGACAFIVGLKPDENGDPTVLNLTWFPLTRDTLFYVISLVMLIVFFTQGGNKDTVEWYESAVLFGIYIAYVTFMLFNAEIEERLVKNQEPEGEIVIGSGEPQSSSAVTQQFQPIISEQNNNITRTSSSTQNMKMIDQPLNEKKDTMVSINAKNNWAKVVANVPTSNSQQFHSRQILALTNTLQEAEIRGDQLASYAVARFYALKKRAPPGSDIARERSRNMLATSHSMFGFDQNKEENTEQLQTNDLDHGSQMTSHSNINTSVGENQESDLPGNPYSLQCPSISDDGFFKCLSYLLILPLAIPLKITIPDVRYRCIQKVCNGNLFVISFIISILWICVFSYLMVWWATRIGETYNIDSALMGLTFLAAGTSVPDLITSVIVAREGHGDMAVSSSIGSNIFDVTVGLPVPWLIYSAINSGKGKAVSSNGLGCSIGLLLLMLVTLITSILATGWKMNRTMGFLMLILYCCFVVVSLALEYGKIKCPF